VGFEGNALDYFLLVFQDHAGPNVKLREGNMNRLWKNDFFLVIKFSHEWKFDSSDRAA